MWRREIVAALTAAVCSCAGTLVNAQDGGQVHGNFSMDGQYYNEDDEIGATVPPERFGFNSWGNLIYTNGAFTAGVRFEAYDPPLLGYPAGQPYDGAGIGYRYASYSIDDLEVTVGNFFEQFGQGMVFRSYEERYLGVDNAMDGVRLKFRPRPGVYLKGVVGQQRFGFDNGFTKGPGLVRGIDAEFSLNELLPSWSEKPHNLILGGSFVSKYQEDRDPLYVLPENVGAWAGRANFISAKWNIYSEYAYKINDPNNKNGFIYKNGQGLLVNATYSTKGLGISAGAHTFDNMFFQSDRTAPTPFDLNIIFLPPLTKQHTYNLPATLYPYATQPNGEVSYQGEIFYKFPKDSKLGGKYGTKVTVNYSAAFNLDSSLVENDEGLEGYRTNFFSPGERTYFKDFNIELRKKLSKTWSLAYTYLNLVYDIDIIQGKPGKPKVYANIHIVEGQYKFTDKNSVRFEVQHLDSKQDLGNWATLLAEFTFSPHWFVAVMDQYNYVTPGNEFHGSEPNRIHYPIGSVGYIRGGNRFTASYGRQRAGIFCVGGVCRNVPAANGLTISVTSTF